jgi:Ca2+-binding EF-hand superfamily protein
MSFLLCLRILIFKKNELILRKYDLNNSGRISSDELYSVLSKMYRNVSRDELDDLIRKADKDRDNLISIDEFIDLLDNY